LLIDKFTFGPISSSKDADHVFPVGKPDCQNSVPELSITEVPRFLGGAVPQILRQDAPLVEEGTLGLCEADAMLGLI
jgi:hypothetical protein